MKLSLTLAFLVPVVFQVTAAAESFNALMRIQAVATNLNFEPIISAAVGEQYQLLVFVTDIRSQPSLLQGVFGAGANVAFNSSLSSLETSQSVTFDSSFRLFRQSTLTPGTANASAIGSLSSTPGNAPQLLFSLPLTATAPGTQNFTLGDAGPEKNFIYGLDRELLPGEVDLVGSTLQIASNPAAGSALAEPALCDLVYSWLHPTPGNTSPAIVFDESAGLRDNQAAIDSDVTPVDSEWLPNGIPTETAALEAININWVFSDQQVDADEASTYTGCCWTIVPEPSSYALATIGVIGLLALKRHRR